MSYQQPQPQQQYYAAPQQQQGAMPDAKVEQAPAYSPQPQAPPMVHQGSMPMQQGIPMQQQPMSPPAVVQQAVYETPLHALNQYAVVARCPRCGHCGTTRIEYEAGGSTHGWAALLCLCFCLGCIPYMVSGLKDVVHFCTNCNSPLATWHRSGRVEVHAPATVAPAQQQQQPQQQYQQAPPTQ